MGIEAVHAEGQAGPSVDQANVVFTNTVSDLINFPFTV